MGYEAGRGLGKSSQGIVEPVSASTQRGRRGLGHILKGLEDEKVTWDPSQEVVEVNEKPEWLPSCTESCPSMQGKYILTHIIYFTYLLPFSALKCPS